MAQPIVTHTVERPVVLTENVQPIIKEEFSSSYR